jgi:hypothetical protein
VEHPPSGVPASRPRPVWQARRPDRTPLYRAVDGGLETFLARAERAERPVPRFVKRELRAYLRCGLLAHGFVRLRCSTCGESRLVAFSCKGRGFCPSCVGRRMADTAAHLVDRVLPQVPIRQWVVSLPHPLRYRLAYDSALCGAVLGLFLRCVFASLRRRARERPDAPARPLRCGAVSFVQRFGDALNLNVHFHCLVIDGVYGPGSDGAARFLALPPPSDAEVARVTQTFARRLERLLVRRGFFEPADGEADPLRTDAPLLAAVYDASVRGRLATGPRAGRRVQRLGDRFDVDVEPTFGGPRCASVGGVSLHANVAVPARDRARLERLCRYVARPPIATERLSPLPDGRLLYRLKRRWRDGTTHVTFEPLELIEKLVALIPAPRAHTVRYHGVLAPAAAGRAGLIRSFTDPVSTGAASPGTPPREAPFPVIVSHPLRARAAGPSTIGAKVGPAPGIQPAGPTPTRRPRPPDAVLAAPLPTPEQPPSALRKRRLEWAELMRRVFRIDVLECPRCGGRLKLLAAIDQPEVIEKILSSLGLSARAPPPAPAQPPDPDLDAPPA